MQNANTLFSSLGSFWTQLFNEKGTLRGLTKGQAEENAQQYIKLVNALKAFSVQDCPVFETTKWFPIVVKKSEFNAPPFVFEQEGAVFGEQPAEDPYYAGITFQFGQPKTPIRKLYVYPLKTKVKKLGVIANRIITPSFACSNGVEFYLKDGDIFFNFDIFESGHFPVAEVIGENGTPVTFERNGVVYKDMTLTLWCYCAEIDTKVLYNTFGTIFDIEKTSSASYKEILQHLMFLRTDGPTVENISAVLLAFAGETPIQEQREVIEDVFDDDNYHIVVTDKHVYKVPLNTQVRQLSVGDILYSGEGISTTVEYFDNVSKPNWWRQYIKPSLFVSENILLGDYNSQVWFDNDAKPLVCISTTPPVVQFPINGNAQDVARFNTTIDAQALIDYFDLTTGASVLINPVDFLFQNFLGTNSALLRLKLNLSDSSLLDAFSYIKKLLPKHVWLLTYFTASQENDEFLFTPTSFIGVSTEFRRFGLISGDTLTLINGDLLYFTIPETSDLPLNADGSNEEGFLPTYSSYKDISQLFSIGAGGPAVLQYETVLTNDTSTSLVLRVNGNTITNSYPSNRSTREVNLIRLTTIAQ